MSNYLVNLALRGAGIPSPGLVEVPAASWGEPIAEDSLEILEPEPKPVSDPFPKPMPETPAQARRVTAMEPTSTLTPHSAPQRDPLPALQAASPHLPHREDVPVEIRTERTETVREAPVQKVEIRETLRETQVLRERIVEKEAAPAQPSPPEPQIIRVEVLRPLSVAETSAPPQSELKAETAVPPQPELKKAVRELVRETPEPRPPRLVQTSDPAEFLLRHPRSTAPEPEASTVPQPPTAPVLPSVPVPRFRQPVLSSQASSLDYRKQAAHDVPREPRGVNQAGPQIRPVEIAEPALPRLGERPRQAARESGVEVKIGSLEIRAVTPTVPPPRSEPQPEREEREEGLDAYRAIRQYSSWFRG